MTDANPKRHQTHHGFTIIEVVIVLAIAALIIAVVLIAVQALTRSQRTKAVQDGATRVVSAMQNWESDQGSNTNLGVGTALGGNYIANAKVPNYVTVSPMAAGANTATLNHMLYGPGTCSSGTFTPTASNTSFSVLYYSESAGASVCVHN